MSDLYRYCDPSLVIDSDIPKGTKRALQLLCSQFTKQIIKDIDRSFENNSDYFAPLDIANNLKEKSLDSLAHSVEHQFSNLNKKRKEDAFKKLTKAGYKTTTDNTELIHSILNSSHIEYIRGKGPSFLSINNEYGE